MENHKNYFDIFRIKPLSYNGMINSNIMFQEFYDKKSISLENSKIIRVDNNKIYTLNRLLLNNNEFKENEYKEGRLKNISLILKNSLDTTEIYTNIPDVFNEMDRYSLNSVFSITFKKFRILPRSVASLFYNEYKNNNERNFIVLDLVGTFLTITLIKKIYSNELKKYILERHRTEKIDLKEDIELIFKDKNIGFKDIGKFLETVGLEFSNLNDFIILNNENKEYSIKENIIIDISKHYEDFKKKNYNDLKNFNIILLSDNLSLKSDISFSYISYKEQLEGSFNYYQTLKNKEDILWRDFLPSLAIKKLYDKFYLIRSDVKIDPIYNKKQKIEVEGTIVLKKGKNRHEFTLVSEKTGEEINYKAVLNNDFPIKEDLECKLELLYTYGSKEEFPFELYFIPLNSNKKMKVEFKKLIEYEYKDLKIPIIPEPNWFYEQEKIIYFEKELNKIYTNMEYCYIVERNLLLDLLSKEGKMVLDTIKNKDKIFNLFNSEVKIKDRIVLLINKEIRLELKENLSKFNSQWVSMNLTVTDKLNKYYNLSFCDSFKDKNGNYVFTDERALIFPSNIIYKNDIDNTIRCVVYEDYEEQNGKLILKNVGNRKYSYGFYRINKTSEVHDGIEYNNPRLVYLMNTIFSGGIYINDKRIPKVISELVKKIIENLKAIYYKSNNKDYIRYILSICLPLNENEYIKDINFEDEKLKKSLTIYDKRALGNSLGNCKNELEKELVNKITTLNPMDAIHILGTGFWKHEEFIINLDQKILFNYFWISNRYLKSFKNSNYFIMSKLLEYVYATFMLRKKNEEKLLKKLSLNNKKIRELYVILEEIVANSLKNKFEIKTFIQFEKTINSEIHPLLYAILSCINGSNDPDIVIKSFEEGEK